MPDQKKTIFLGISTRRDARFFFINRFRVNRINTLLFSILRTTRITQVRVHATFETVMEQLCLLELDMFHVAAVREADPTSQIRCPTEASWHLIRRQFVDLEGQALTEHACQMITGLQGHVRDEDHPSSKDESWANRPRN